MRLYADMYTSIKYCGLAGVVFFGGICQQKIGRWNGLEKQDRKPQPFAPTKHEP